MKVSLHRTGWKDLNNELSNIVYISYTEDNQYYEIPVGKIKTPPDFHLLSPSIDIVSEEDVAKNGHSITKEYLKDHFMQSFTPTSNKNNDKQVQMFLDFVK
jgi:hypothetical protein